MCYTRKIIGNDIGNIMKEQEESKDAISAGIVIPNADSMTKAELAKAKNNEYQRRLMAKRRGKEDKLAVKETNQGLRKLNTEEMVELSKDTRNTVIQLLNKKLLELYDDPEALAKINLATLATTFGILFDKAQLAAGLSTENIAISAKIDINMNSASALEELNKMRESFTQGNG